MIEEKMIPEPGFHIIKEPDEIKWLTGLDFVFVLPNDFQQYAQIKRWCNENCEDTVAFLGRGHLRYEEQVYFFSESDAMAFKMKWL